MRDGDACTRLVPPLACTHNHSMPAKLRLTFTMVVLTEPMHTPHVVRTQVGISAAPLQHRDGHSLHLDLKEIKRGV